MLRRRQARGIMWAAAVATGLASVVGWWTVLEDGSGGSDIIAPAGLGLAAIIWVANALAAKAAAGAAGGEQR